LHHKKEPSAHRRFQTHIQVPSWFELYGAPNVVAVLMTTWDSGNRAHWGAGGNAHIGYSTAAFGKVPRETTTAKKTGTSLWRQSDRFLQTHTGFMTWLEMSGSGRQTGIRRIIRRSCAMREAWRAIQIDPRTASTPSNPACRQKSTAEGSFLCTDQYRSRYAPGGRGKGARDTGTNHLGFRCVSRRERSTRVAMRCGGAQGAA